MPLAILPPPVHARQLRFGWVRMPPVGELVRLEDWTRQPSTRVTSRSGTVTPLVIGGSYRQHSLVCALRADPNSQSPRSQTTRSDCLSQAAKPVLLNQRVSQHLVLSVRSVVLLFDHVDFTAQFCLTIV